MAAMSEKLRDEIFSKFTDVFPQFKTFSTYYKRLLVIWYFRLFVKCATISMILLLGICYYRNGVFNYSKDAGLYLVVLIICVFNSARQLRRDRRLEMYFLDASDAFEGMTEILLKWCGANNPSFAKMLKLLLEEMNGDRSNELNTKDLLSLLIFDGIIWFANTTCLLVNMFNQFYFTVLIFFVTTLMTIAMENLLVNMKNKPYKINENMTAEIDKICSIVNNYKEVTNDTDNSYGKTKTETTDVSKENIFTVDYFDLQKRCEEKVNLNKSMIFPPDSEQKNSANNNCENNRDTPNAENIWIGNEVGNGPQQLEPLKNSDDHNKSDALFQKGEKKSEHDSGAENICIESEVDYVSQQFEILENDADDLNPAATFLQEQEKKVDLDSKFDLRQNNNIAFVEEEDANNIWEHNFGALNSENICTGNGVHNVPQQLEPLKNGYDLNPLDAVIQKQKEKIKHDFIAPNVENICTGNEVDNIPQQLEPLKNCEDLSPLDALFEKQEEKSEYYSTAPDTENICTGNEVDSVSQECENLKNSDDLNLADVLFQKQEEKSRYVSCVKNEENICIGNEAVNVTQKIESLENGVHDINPENTYLQGQKKKANLDTNFASTDNKSTASVEEESANNNCVDNLDIPKAENIFTGSKVHKIPEQLCSLKNTDDLKPVDAIFQRQEEKGEYDSSAPNPENICTGNEVDNVPQQLEPLKHSDDLSSSDAFFQKREENSENDSGTPNAENICTGNEVDNFLQQHLKNGDDLKPSDAVVQKQEEKSEHNFIAPNAENICTGNEVDNVPQQREPLKTGDDHNPSDALNQKQEEKSEHYSIASNAENIFTENEVDNVPQECETFKNSDDLKPSDAVFQKQEQKRKHGFIAPNAANICSGNEVDNVPQQREPLKNGDELNPSDAFFQKQAEKRKCDSGEPKFEGICIGSKVDNVPQQLEPLKNGEDLNSSDALSQKQEAKSEHYSIAPNAGNICTGNEVDNLPQDCEPFKNGDDLNHADVIFQKQEQKSGHDSGVPNDENISMKNAVNNVSEQLEHLENSVYDLNPGNTYLQGQKQKIILVTNFIATDNKNTDSVEEESANNNNVNNLDTPKAENIFAGNEVDKIRQQLFSLKNGDDPNPSDAFFQKQEENSENDSGASKVEGIRIVNEVNNVPQQLEPLKNGEDLIPSDALSQKQKEKREHYSIAPNAENICTGNEVDNVPQECQPFKNGDDINRADVIFQKQEQKSGHDSVVPNDENICMENEMDNISQQLEPLENSVHNLNPGNTFLQGQKQKVNLVTNFVATDNKNTASVEEESANNNCVNNLDTTPKAENIFARNEVGKIPQQLGPLKNSDDLNPSDAPFQKQEENRENNSGAPKVEGISSENEVDNVPQQRELLKNGDDLNPSDALSQKQEEKSELYSIAPNAGNICTGNEVDSVPQEYEPLKNGDDLNPADILFQKQEGKSGHDSGVPNDENICMENEVDNVSQQLEPLENVYNLNPGNIYLRGQKQKVNLDTNFLVTDNKNTDSVEEESANNNNVNNLDTPKAENIFAGNEVDKIPVQLGPLKNGDDLNPSDAPFQKQEENRENDFGAPKVEVICIVNEVDYFPQQLEPLKNDALSQKQEEKSEHYSIAPNAENICTGNEVENVPQEYEPVKNGDDLKRANVLFQKQVEKNGHDSGVPNDENISMENEVENVSQQLEPLENSVYDLHPGNTFLQGQKQKVNLVTNFVATDNKNTASVEEESANNNCVNSLDTPKAENIFARNEVDKIPKQLFSLKNGDDPNPSDAFFQKQEENSENDSGASKVEGIRIVNEVNNVPQQLEPLKNGEDLIPSDALSQKQKEKSEHYSIAPNAENICTGNEVDNVPQECQPFKNGDDINRADVIFQKQEQKSGHDSVVPNDENICMENEMDNISQQLEPLENSVHNLNPGNTFLQGQKQKVNLVTNFVATDNKNTASVEEESANNNCVNNLDTPKAENIFEVDKIPQQLGPLKNGDDLNPADVLFHEQEEKRKHDSIALNAGNISTWKEIANVPEPFEFLKNDDDLNPSEALFQKQEEKREHDSGAPNGENICIVNESINDTKRSKSLENYKNEENIKYDILSKNELAEEDILVKEKTCKRNKNIQNYESDNNNSSNDCVEKIVLSSEIKNPDSYSDILGNSSGLSNFSSNQKQKFNITEESIFDPFVKPLDSHITVIQRKNINNSFEQLSGSKENYEIFPKKEQESSARTENILNSDKKCEPCITAHKLETPFVSNIYKAYEQHSESVMAETREVKSAENRNTERDFFYEKELKYEARGSTLENSLDDNDTLNCLLTPETHVISPSVTLEDEAAQLLGTENSEKAEDVISHTELSTENASMRELSMGTENIPIKNTEFEDIKNITERKFSVNVSHQNEADATVSDSCGKLPSKITEFKNPEKESRHRLTPNEATSIKAKCNVFETDTKIPNVSEKNHSDTSSGCISRKSAGSTTERKYIASTFPYSDTADESGDDVHFVLKKHRPSDINRRKDAEQRKKKVCDENQFQMTNTMLHNTEQFSERKIALNYGKFAFCMDLYPESEIELVFKSSGKSMKRSTVYPFKGHK